MAQELRFKKLDSQAIIPQFQTKGAAGFDFHALEATQIKPGEVTLVRTGLSVEVPEGFEMQVRARSGLSAKAGIFLVNGVGTIDSDYRGEIKIIMSTCMNKPVEIKAGDRIAQGVIAAVVQPQIVEVSELSETERGSGGFGSTGVSRS
jgi:dUTP pyrophosphatase